jgi:hypothetical protein
VSTAQVVAVALVELLAAPDRTQPGACCSLNLDTHSDHAVLAPRIAQRSTRRSSIDAA